MLGDLHRLVIGCAPLLQRGGVSAVLALLALLPFAVAAAGAQVCCAFLFIFGGWSFVSALAHVGPYAAFAHVAAGEPLGAREALRAARRGLFVTFSVFFLHFLLMVVLYFAAMYGVIAGTMIVSGVNDDGYWFLGVGAIAAVVVVAYLALAVSARWLFLAPVVAIAEDIATLRGALRRAGGLAKGRLPVLTLAMLVPYLAPVVFSPELTGLARLDDARSGLREIVSVVGPILGCTVSIYATGLLTTSAYLVVTGRSPRTDDEDPVPA